MAEAVDIDENVLRVGARTPPHDLAAAIAHACYEHKPPILRAIGAGAVNQAVKALAIASQYTAGRAMSLTSRIGWANVNMNGDTVSAIVFKVVIDE